MSVVLKALAAAAMLASATSLAAAPAPSSINQLPGDARGLIVQVHGDHASCRRDRRGWHRHNRWGERRSCRRWDGRGKRPDLCVRVGPIWYCDY